MQLIARKSFRYSSRQLEVGDAFEANTRDARMFVLLGKAQEVKTSEPLPLPQSVQDELDTLRAQATEVGINVDRRWGAARLQEEIAKVKR